MVAVKSPALNFSHNFKQTYWGSVKKNQKNQKKVPIKKLKYSQVSNPDSLGKVEWT